MAAEEKKCPNCGNLCNLDDIFCNKCGTKLNIEGEDSAICPDCGAPYTSNVDLFCKVCGKQLQKQEFKCPNCGAIPERSDIFCGECGAKLHSSGNKSEVLETPNIESEIVQTKKCPYCGESLNGDIMKCPHCGEWLKRKRPFGCYGILSTTIFIIVLIAAWIITEDLLIALIWGFGITLALWMYFVPAWVAEIRNHPNAGAIFAVNLLFGVTGGGWIISLIWALCGGGKDK